MSLISNVLPPDSPSGAILPNAKYRFGIVEPLTRLNLITNPSFERATTGWTATGGITAARTTTVAYAGAYGLNCTGGAAGDGVYYDSFELISGRPYVASISLHTLKGSVFQLQIRTSGGSIVARKSFRGSSGQWRREHVFYTPVATANYRLYVVTDAGDAFTIDAAQVESCEDGYLEPTTYLDGDMLAPHIAQYPSPYYWLGAPHASPSLRQRSTASGGRLVWLDTLSLNLVSIQGAGLGKPTHFTASQPAQDGVGYQGTLVGANDLILVGTISEVSSAALNRTKARLAELFGADRAFPRQPIRLYFRMYDSDGIHPISLEGYLDVVYVDGIDISITSAVSERFVLKFQQLTPYVFGPSQGIELFSQDTLFNTSYLARRTKDTLWTRLADGPNSAPNVVAVGPDGRVYIGGQFTLVNSVTNTKGIAVWDPVTETWSPLGSGITVGGAADVYAIAVAADSTVYVGGTFTNAGGVTAARIAKYSGGTWSTVGTSGDINGAVRALALDGLGNLYVGGSFTNAGGVASADYLARFTKAGAWEAAVASVALNSDVYALQTTPTQTVFVGGSFTDADGLTEGDYVFAIDPLLGSVALGAEVLNGNVLSLYYADGYIYAAGGFTLVGTRTVAGLARWNGTGWEGIGLSGPNGVGNDVAVTPVGEVWLGGFYSTIGGIEAVDGLAYFNGTSWLAPDINFPSTSSVNALAVDKVTGTVYVAFTTAGDSITAYVDTLTVEGTAPAAPTVKITGPVSLPTAALYTMRNLTTGQMINFSMEILKGEILTLTTFRGLTLTSNLRGNLTGYLRRGSTLFQLIPGLNTLAFYGGGSIPSITVSWPQTYNSLVGLQR